MKYRVSELAGWFIIRPSGTAENNEPLRVRHLFRRWLAREGVKVIVDLHELKQFGVWGVGLLTSFKREVDQRGGTLRICRLNPLLKGYFQASCADGSSCATAIASGGQLGRAARLAVHAPGLASSLVASGRDLQTRISQNDFVSCL